MDLTLKLDAEQVQQLIRGGLPAADKSGLLVEAVQPGLARIRFPFRNWMLRPGNSISGPTLFTVADTAMYALVLSHVGPELMAVTASLNINFLARPKAGDVVGEARLLKLGRRLVVMEVALFTADQTDVVAHVTGSYALPGR